MENILKIFVIALSFGVGVISLHFMLNSKEIYNAYKKTHRKKPKTTWEKLNAPNDNIRKLHLFLSPLMVGLSLFSIVFILQNW